MGLPWIFGLWTPLAWAMMDIRHFADTENPVPLPQFTDPGIRPPSLIYAENQFWPPYNVSVETFEPFPGCDAQVAAACGVQHAIRMVSRAREQSCPMLNGTLADRQAALDSLNANAYEPEGTRNFGVFLLDPDAVILADPLRPTLVGHRFDGFFAAGFVAQPTLRAYIDWVVSWEGGFVPHVTTRLEPTNPAPVKAVAYIEPCPSGERLGVAIGRKAIPAVESCNPNANNFCAVQNLRRLMGLNLLDYLSSSNYELHQDQQMRISYTTDYSVGPFYTFRYLQSWWGAPGPDPWQNPTPLNNNMGTCWATGGGLHAAFNGRNISELLTATVAGINAGNWLMHKGYTETWRGGAWGDYVWNTPELGVHTKMTFGFGVVWNGTALNMGAGTVHAPDPPVLAPNCQECSPGSSLLCAAVNSKRLAAHAQMDFLKPTGGWDPISTSRWFGSLRPSAQDPYPPTWPSGVYVFAMSYSGNVVADGSTNSTIGTSVHDFFGDNTVDAKFKTAANNGGSWVPYTLPNGAKKLAYSIKLAKAGKFYYLGVAFTNRRANWISDCTSRYAEPCSEHNAQVMLGAANADIVSASSMAEFLEVLRSIHGRSGGYSTAQAGDFSVHVYTSSWTCLPEAIAAGIPCPPGISADSLSDLNQAALQEPGNWTDGSRIVLLDPKVKTPQRAFAFRTTFQVPGSVSLDLTLLAVVSADLAPPRCSSGPCPAHASCRSDGRCHCDFGFREDFTEDAGACDALKPATLTCTDVTGLHCEGTDCAPCPKGHYCPEGSRQACPPGTFCPGGEAGPRLCEAGRYGVKTHQHDSSACLQCDRGRFSSKPGETSCEACPAGRFSDLRGQSGCSSCGVGFYQAGQGNTTCLACPRGTTTALLGAMSVQDCLCKEGTFMSREGGSCHPCPGGMRCCVGSALANLDDPSSLNLVSGGDAEDCVQPAFPTLEKRHWSSGVVGEETLVFDCYSEKRCPGGRPGTCGPNLQGKACASCVENYYWDGEKCAECSLGRTTAGFLIFPVLPIAMGFIILMLLYLRMNDPYLQWGSWANTITALVFVMLNHYQAIDIIGSTKVPATTRLANTYEIWAVTNDILSIFRISCHGFADTKGVMALKAVSPIVLGLIILLLMVGAQIVSRVRAQPNLRLEPNRLFNVYFSILFTLFGAISAMSLDLFKCKANPAPNTALSLAVDASVICYTSSEWKSMLAVGISSVLVYVVGVGILLCRTVMIARQNFGDAAFRRRWSFLFIKYRLGIWWWGLAFLSKNFLVNLSLVIFSSPLFQFLFIQLVISLYLIFVQMLYPYRSIWANRLEVFAGLSIIVNTTVMSAFTFVAEKEYQKDALGDAAMVFSYLPLFLGGCYCLYLAFYGVQVKVGTNWGRKYEARKMEYLKNDAAAVLSSFTSLSQLQADGCALMLKHMGEYERMRFLEVDGMICSELDDITFGLKKSNQRSNQLSAQGSWSRMFGDNREELQSKIRSLNSDQAVEPTESAMTVRVEPSWDQEFSVTVSGSKAPFGASRGAKAIDSSRAGALAVSPDINAHANGLPSAWATRLNLKLPEEEQEAIPRIKSSG